MISLIEIFKEIKREQEEYFKNHPYSELDEWLIKEEVLLGELLDPNSAYPYEGSKGYYTYKDNSGDVFFVRMYYVPKPQNYMEFKTGWIDENNKTHYEPSVPPHSKNSSAIYATKRSDTVAKIYRDEILPFFLEQNLTDIMLIKPISTSRMKFAERLVKKFTPTDKFDIEYGSPLIIKKK